MTDLFEGEETGAEFSPCRKYRYHLWRIWDKDLPVMIWIMMNPSTADEVQNDPTIRRCICFAKRDGYGGVSIRNVFAFRATNPKDMIAEVDPFGPGNGDALWNCRRPFLLSQVVCAWGKPVGGKRLDDGYKQARNAAAANDALCLGTNQDGSPKHPLYIHGETKLIPYSLQK